MKKTTQKQAEKILQDYVKSTMTATRARLEDQAKEGKHGARWIENRMKAKREHLDLIEAARDIDYINIGVEWKKSRTWGNNPTATITLEAPPAFKRATGTASGCGYDKESAAIAEALNACPAIERALIIASEGGKLNRESGFPYGATVTEYGAHFSDGVGVESFRGVFEFMGFKWERVAGGKTFDAYTVRKA